MASFMIKFEGMTFIAVISDYETISISTLITKPVDKQMFFHIRESLRCEIEEGYHSIAISNAINDKVKVLEL